MSGNLNFNRKFADYGPDTRDFERSRDVLKELTELVCGVKQTIGAFIGAKFTSVWLHEGDATGIEDDLDLIFINQEDGFLDIVLRQNGVPVYGGFLDPSVSVNVTDDVVNGLRVIIGTDESGNKTRYEFTGSQYIPVGPALSPTSMSPGRAQMRRVLTPS